MRAVYKTNFIYIYIYIYIYNIHIAIAAPYTIPTIVWQHLNPIIVCGTSNALDVEDCSVALIGMTETGIRTLEMYSGQKLFTAARISRQSLYFMRKLIGSQCSFHIATTTGSCEPGPETRQTAAFIILFSSILWNYTVPQTQNYSSQWDVAQRLRQDIAS